MTLRRKLVFTVLGLVLGAGVAGTVAGLTLWYVRAGMGPLLQDVPTVATLLTRGLWLVGGTSALAVLAGAGAGWWLVHSLQASLEVLRDAVNQVQSGRLDTRVPVDTDDELGRLARALNRMTTTLSRRTVSRSYLHAVLDSMAELLFVVDDHGRVRHANQAASEALGRPKEALRDTALSTHFDTDPLATDGDDPVECRVHSPDGASVPVLVSRSTLRGADSGAGDIVCVAQDISARKETEDQLRRSLQEKEVLLRELHHRVKNNLQVISSLLHAQAQSVDDPAVKERFRESQDRIRSMASIHEQLYQSDNLARVDFDAYLETLTDELFRSYRTGAVTCSLDVVDQALPIDQAIPAGLIVNELVSNALEHAFPRGQGGTVHVQFRAANGEATLVVADDGDGAEALDAEDSLGVRLVRGLTRQLRGTLSADIDDGVTVTVTFPLDPSE